MDARPTEFMGKVYKSKTEAMFAYILHSRLDVYSRFTYEEQRFKTDKGYIPDFVRYHGVNHFLADYIEILEVKPAIPNATYIKYLEEQFAWLRENDKYHFISFYALYVFNPYNNVFDAVLMDLDTGKIEVEYLERPVWFDEKYFDEVLNYRFDL